MVRRFGAKPLLLVLIGTLLLSGCVKWASVTASYPLRDETVVSPQLTPKRHVMVIPPSGTARGQFDAVIALFERELLKSGVTVISGAITGRVVIDAAGGTDRRIEAAAALSDAERALIMAKQTGADAILQIGQLDWSEQMVESRFFVCCRGGAKGYMEVSQTEYQNWREKKAALPSHWLTFVGRLMDVQNGEILASFKINGGANYSLPADYQVQIDFRGNQPKLMKENYSYAAIDWAAAKQRTVERVIELVARRLLPR